jgi:CrcB protein
VLNVVVVALGAAVGAPLRYAVDRLVRLIHAGSFPFGTLAVNLIASAVLGLVAGLTAAGSASHHLQLLVGTGFCATLSTYSTFSFETLRLGEEEGAVAAIAYTCISVAGGLGAAFLGVWIA